MASVKRISSSYSIVGTTGNTDVSIGNPTLNSALFSVHGNVAFDAGANTGITAVGGSIPNGIIWSETLHRWLLSNDGTTFSPIATFSGNTGTGLQAVVDDLNPALGGNLVVNGFPIISTSNNIVLKPSINAQIDSAIQLLEISTGPSTSIPGFNLIYANVPGSGGSGVYVTNESAIGEELITKSKAIIYSIIF